MSQEWIDEQLRIAKLMRENQSLMREKGLTAYSFFDSPHIEVYEEVSTYKTGHKFTEKKLRKVVYSEDSLNFYLKGVKAAR